MRRTNDPVFGAALDHMQPHRLGKFPDRVSLVMEALRGLDDMNQKAMEAVRPAHVTEEDYQVYLVAARMRSTAARVWLLTIYAHVSARAGQSFSNVLQLGIAKIWTMLALVEGDDLLQHAEFFTGTYFNGVKSDPMNLKHWPHFPEV